MHPLQAVSDFIRNHRRVAVIFDLDSTLFCVSPRTQAILRRLGGLPEFKSRFAREAEILTSIDVHPTDWGVRAVLERAQLGESPLEFFLEVRDYWHRYFFSNHDLDQDHIYPSADEYVKHLEFLGANILYLTGRPEESMREGTLKALTKWGFPFGRLIMKPTAVETDESFKAHVLKDLTREYDHIWFFENEPVIIERVRPLVPQVKIVFMNSIHAGRSPSPTDLPTIGMDYRPGLPKR